MKIFLEIPRAISLVLIFFFVVAFLLPGCASRRASYATPPRFIELSSKPSAATLHFPRGLYSLDHEDRTGYYYRAPRKITQHSFGGSVQHDGGLFVRKSARQTLRGYVVWAGGLTKVGNFSRTDYKFRD